MGKLSLILRGPSSRLWLGPSLGLSLSLAAVGFSGCLDDPEDPKTWIKKLDDVREQKEALRHLAKLKDESSIEPLTKLFRRSKDPEHLRVIQQIRSDKALDLFIEQLDYSDDSYDNASVAATGIYEIATRDDKGREAAKKAVPDLIKAVSKKLPIRTRANVVKVEAMRALGAIKDPSAVDALDKVLETSADDQDFFLNKQAAKHLAEFADARSVPSLIRGLWMTGRGTDIFPECRLALVRIGDPAVDKLIETMQRKNTAVEEDAKKYEFIPGIVVQKAAILLGDLRSKKALPALLAELNKKDDGATAQPGVSGHQSVLQAIGFIGDPGSVKTVIGVLSDSKRNPKARAAAAEALNLENATDGLPAMLAAAKTSFITAKGEQKEVDQEKATLAALAVTQFSRLADKDESAAIEPILKPIPKEFVDFAEAFQNAIERVKLAGECKKDIACYGKALGENKSARAERAAFSLSRLGHDAVPVLVKNVGHKDTAVRTAVLYALTRVATKADQDVAKALDAQIDIDSHKDKVGIALADEMRVSQAIISHR
jgi:HEAT repeat protein